MEENFANVKMQQEANNYSKPSNMNVPNQQPSFIITEKREYFNPKIHLNKKIAAQEVLFETKKIKILSITSLIGMFLCAGSAVISPVLPLASVAGFGFFSMFHLYTAVKKIKYLEETYKL